MLFFCIEENVKLMKKLFVFAILLVSLLGAAACGSTATPLPNSSEDATPPVGVEVEITEAVGVPTEVPATATPEGPGYKDIAYEVEETQVLLVNGVAEMEAAPGSATKITTRYFGNEVFGDLNGDGKEDVAFLLTQDPGGSGTFYYVVVAWRTESGYSGSNGVFLGDRIAPQSMAIENGLVVVNYAERKPGEDFAAQPSVGVTRQFSLKESRLAEVILAAQLTNRTWKWVRMQMSDGTLDSPIQQDAFTIIFSEDGQVNGTTDCNSFFGSYTQQENRLSFGQFGTTK